MQTYVLSIAGAVLITAVITIIAPGGKMGKFVKGAMKLFLLIVLASPLIGWLGKGEISLGSSKIGTDADYLASCAAMMEASDEREIAQLIREQFSVEATADVERKADATFAYEKITVEIFDFGIFGQDEHKDITDRVQAFLEERYGCAVGVS